MENYHSPSDESSYLSRDSRLDDPFVSLVVYCDHFCTPPSYICIKSGIFDVSKKKIRLYCGDSSRTESFIFLSQCLAYLGIGFVT